MSETRPAPVPPCSPDELHERLLPLVDSPLPFYLNAECRPCATLDRGSTPHRVIVLSIPKAGTYFLAELLREWGCAPTHLHLAHDSAWDYRQRTLEEIRVDSFRYQVTIPLRQSVALIDRGQFAVGHLECTPEIRSALGGFRKIFIYRDLRDALISQMRFLVDSPSTSSTLAAWKDATAPIERMAGFMRDHKHTIYMFSLFLEMAGWLAEPDVFGLSFEQLYGDVAAGSRDERLQSLYAFLDLPSRPEHPARTADRLVGSNTRTWSGVRSSRETYWDDTVERLFAELGGTELNAAYGYEM
jgi:hypothetical protein